MKNLYQKVKAFAITVVKGILALFRKHSELAVIITANLKKAVESPIADGVVTIIPGDVDNALLRKLRKIIPAVAFKVAVANKILKENEGDGDVVIAVINHLKEEHPNVRTSFWVMFSAELIVALSDGKLSLSEALILGQMLYNELFPKK